MENINVFFSFKVEQLLLMFIGAKFQSLAASFLKVPWDILEVYFHEILQASTIFGSFVSTV